MSNSVISNLISPLISKVLITSPVPELELTSEKYLEPHKLATGLADSREEFHRIPDDHIQNNLKMNRTIIDQSWYLQFEESKSVVIDSSYVDVLL